MARSHQPRIVAGLLVGALLTAPLIAVLYAAWGLIGLPFVPYDMFDLMARVLPGRVITSGIDMVVTIIRTLDIGPTSVVAKAAEHAFATGGLFPDRTVLLRLDGCGVGRGRHRVRRDCGHPDIGDRHWRQGRGERSRPRQKLGVVICRQR